MVSKEIIEAQTVFQGDQTKDHFSSCEEPILLWSSFFVFLHFKPFFLFISFHFISFHFIFLLHFSFRFLQYCCFAFAHLYSFSGVSSTPLELHFFTFAFQHQAFDRLSLREDFSLPLPPVLRVILGRDIEGNLSGLKRVTMDNFHISDGMMKDGHFSF